jgi:hypothetical protein
MHVNVDPRYRDIVFVTVDVMIVCEAYFEAHCNMGRLDESHMTGL